MFTGIDHIAVAKHDIGPLARCYEQLGFALTPFSRHAGQADSSGRPMAGGTGNQCAMLEQGYLESIGMVDIAADTRGLPALIARHAGVHILALESSDPLDDQRRLASSGFDSFIAELNRDVAVDGCDGVARFTQVRVADTDLPEARIFGIRHETPELVWLPDYLDHPNGAVGLAEVLISVANLESASARYARFIGVEPAFDGGVARFSLDRGTLTLASQSDAARLAPKIPLHRDGQVLAFTVAVRDLGQTAALLRDNHVPFDAANDRIVVDPRFAGDAGCSFQQSQ